MPVLGVGAKKDLNEERQISVDTADFEESTHLFYDLLKCSAKTGDNIKEVFHNITYKMVKNNNLI
ncbi:MAG: hypothetical protein EU532_02110 [Promethearchaeota archaeon]|nr:MAG: hypothetical protein EU532_02110 [Candidatus Lokiarchaeota archaeon]